MDSLDITIDLAPTIDAGPDTVICEGDSVQLINATSGGSTTAIEWSGGAGYFFPDATTLNAYYVPDASEIGTQVLLTLSSDNPAGPCDSVTNQVTVQINKAPEVEAGSDKIVCEGDIVVQGDASFGGTTSSISWVGGLGTFTPNRSTLNAIYSPDASEVNSTIRLYIVSNDPGAPCVIVMDSLDITIDLAPTVDAGPDTVICEGDSVQLVNATSGGSTTAIEWSGGVGYFFPDATTLNAYYVPDASEIGTQVLLTLSSDNPVGPCDSVTNQVIVTINKAPEIYAGTDKVICEGSNAVLGDAIFGGTTSSVTWSGGLGSFIPNANTLNAIYTPDATEIGDTVTLYIQTNDPSGPCVAVMDTVDIAVNTAPVVNAGIQKTICEADSAFLSDASFSGSTVAIEWSGGTGRFSPDIYTLNAYYVPDTTEIGAEVILTLSSDNPTGPCDSVTSQVIVKVNKAPEVVAGADKVICEGETVTMGDATFGGTTASVEWLGGAGSFIPNRQTLNAIYSPDTSEIASTVTLVLKSNDPSGPCDFVTDSMYLTINKAPEVNAGLDKVICEGDSAIMSDATIGGTTSSIRWSGGSGAFYPNDSTLSAYYIPDPTEVGTSVTLTITSDDPSGPCGIVYDNVDIQINRAPTVYAGADVVVCEGSDVNLNGSIGGGASSATWSGGTGTFIDITHLGTNYTPDVTEIGDTVTLYLTTNNPVGPCIAVYDSMEIAVNLAPTVSAGLDTAVCIFDTVQLNGSFGGSASGITWTGGFGTYSDPTDPKGLYIPVEIEKGGDVILTITTDDPAGPCPAVNDKIFVTVNSLPNTLIFGIEPRTAINEPPIKLNGVPGGGVFAGNGIERIFEDGDSVTYFNPWVAGEGYAFITYGAFDDNGCYKDVYDSTEVIPLPDVSILGLERPFCEDGERVIIFGDPPGGTFGGDVVPIGDDFYFDPKSAGAGLAEILYTYTDTATAVTDTDTSYVTVLPIPKVTSITYSENNSCIDDTISVTIDATIGIPSNIVYYRWGITGSEPYADSTGTGSNSFVFPNPGKYELTYTILPTSFQSVTCFTSESFDIIVGDNPIVDYGFSRISLGDTTRFVGTGTVVIPQTKSYLWEFDDGNTGTDSLDYNAFGFIGSYYVTLDVSTDKGCFGSVSKWINILPDTVITIGNPYFQDFEPENFDYWFAEPDNEGDSISWELGEPSGKQIMDAYSGITTWITSRSGVYRNNEYSYLNTPQFNLSGLNRPMMQFRYWNDLEKDRAGVFMEYSTNGGSSWNVLGDIINSTRNNNWYGNDWYNVEERQIFANIGGSNNGAGQNFTLDGWVGWTGYNPDERQNNGWKLAQIPLDQIGLSDLSSVRFRYVFVSGADVPLDSVEGFAIDDFWIGERTKNVVLELFTNLNGGSTMDAFRDDIYYIYNDPSDLDWDKDMILLQYHTGKPVDTDEIYQDNERVVDDRLNFYDENTSSFAMLDGKAEGYFYRYNDNTWDYNDVYLRALRQPWIDIQLTDVSAPTDLSRVSVQTEISLLDTAIIGRPVHFYMVFVEEMIDEYGSQMRYVVKEDDPAGGYTDPDGIHSDTSYVRTWDISSDRTIYNNPGSRLGVAVFVQDKETKEIFQASYVPILSQKTSEPPTGIEEDLIAQDLANVVLYPNPTRKYLYVDFGREVLNDYIWEIIDHRGVIMGRGEIWKGTDRFEIDTSLLPNGLHILLMGTKDGLKLHRKITVIH
ncbi:PKD domain-containing protein [Bacteroidota bacterium]